MKRYLTNAQMRRADRETMKEVPSLELMERAGKAVAEEAKKHGSSFLFVCGGGNNGGDGYVAARYLFEEGFRVAVYPVGAPSSDECKTNASRYLGDVAIVLSDGYDVVVDCLFGTGLSRAVDGENRKAIEWMNETPSYVLSVDAPSGLNGTSGQIMGACVRADSLLAIAYEKVGFVLGDGLDVCKNITVADIGIRATEGNFSLEESDLNGYFPKRKHNVHKGTFARATLVAGSKRYSGAACLALSALLKMGAGYTELCTAQDLLPYLIGRYPEAILSAREDFVPSKAVGIGSGCEVSEQLYEMIQTALESECTLVIDADGINALALYGRDILKRKKAKVILTPHVGEFSRLSGKTKEDILADPVLAAKEFAEEYGVVVLLKNAVSVITDGEQVFLNTTGSPALAKGGSGDVLCGIVTGLATRLSPLESAFVGAYLLGKAGERSAEKNGVYSSQASDVAAELPSLLRLYAEQAQDE
ncbi:MAG: NAD(P)H-hydrate dehydratase [Clostridia bacterium]|nr:NAD(P)H-hydrate dehydratase [Clostridia bacterium]